MSPPTQYRLPGRQFYRSKDPTNSIKELKEHKNKHQKNTINTHTDCNKETTYLLISHIQKTHKIPRSTRILWVTRGWLPQGAGLPSLNGSVAATAVPPFRSK